MDQKPSTSKVTRFKQFAKEHPGLIGEVRNHKRSWQDIYEEWDIYGEDSNLWQSYRESSLPTEAADTKSARGDSSRPAPKKNNAQGKGLNLGSLFSLIEKIDFDQFQKGLSQASGALETIQKLMGNNQNNNSAGGTNPYGNGQQAPYGNGAPGPYGNRPPGPFGNGAPGGGFGGNGMPGPYNYNAQGYGPPRPQGYGPYPPPYNNNGNNMGNGNNMNNANNMNNGNPGNNGNNGNNSFQG